MKKPLLVLAASSPLFITGCAGILGDAMVSMGADPANLGTMYTCPRYGEYSEPCLKAKVKLRERRSRTQTYYVIENGRSRQVTIIKQ